MFIQQLLLGIIVLCIQPSHAILLTTLQKDLICACRKFNTPKSHLADLKTFNINNTTDEVCTRLGFTDRWAPMFPKHKNNELGVGEGLRAQVYVSTSNPHAIVIAFRHFEHDMGMMVDRDFWQEQMMYGLDQDQLNHPLWGSFYITYQSLVRNVMHFLGFDYFKYSCHFVQELLDRNKNKYTTITFTGFGDGGVFAALQTSRIAGSTGVVFATKPFHDFTNFFGYSSTRRLEILALQGDDDVVPAAANAHRTCVFSHQWTNQDIVTRYPNTSIHDLTIYSDEYGLLSDTMEGKQCIEPIMA